ncbi:hypothetical protein AB1Y20_005398 [Prymnesium parvum]|uniref:Calcineurin-like phosphoesterase domain-containing protein n=1 Tax=Prymnesium parvum TaxID=97485 RepID=A0AB34J5P6_PRYPA
MGALLRCLVPCLTQWHKPLPERASASVAMQKEPTPTHTAHATLSADPRCIRTIVIGDVHGCLLELKQLLTQCEYRAERDCVVLVGDLVNKGPLSAEVVSFVREQGFFCVRGNHDETALREWEEREQARRNGREPASSEKYAYTDRFSEADVQFLQAMPYTLSLPHLDTIVVHAGLVPGVQLAEQQGKDMTRMRDVKPSDGGWHASEKQDGVPWASVWPGPTHVIFGHDAKRRLQQHAHATGLDTGCCYGGELTALILPEKRLVSVSAMREYAPRTG